MNCLASPANPAARPFSYVFCVCLVLIASLGLAFHSAGATFYDSEYLIDSWQAEQGLPCEDVALELQLHAVPLVTHADPGMLDQVLMNLAVNLRDAMPGGGRLLIKTSAATVDYDASLLIPDAAPGAYACLSVTDTGTGIPPTVLPRIFEPFFTTKETGKGTGLGLATVFGIVKQHRGWIKVENRPGEGVTFGIFLPITTSAAAEPASIAAGPRPTAGRETILLVEDEPAVRAPLRMLLQRHGYRVLEAANGTEALELWGQNRSTIALLLTDMIMPGGLGGRVLARRLVAQKPQLKVIYISGYSADVAGQDVKLGEAEAFVQKPFTTSHLLGTIRRVLDA